MSKSVSSMLAILSLLLPMAAANAAERPEPRDPGMRWFEDLDAALAEARDRNIPIFVALHKDH